MPSRHSGKAADFERCDSRSGHDDREAGTYRLSKVYQRSEGNGDREAVRCELWQVFWGFGELVMRAAAAACIRYVTAVLHDLVASRLCVV